MTISIQEIGNGAGIELIASGTIYDRQIIAALSEVYADSNFPQLQYLLIDRSACTRYYVGHAEIRGIVDMARTAATVNSSLIKAIISPNAFSNQIAEMWKVQLTDVFAHIGTFYEREEAIKWIGRYLPSIVLPQITSHIFMRPHRQQSTVSRIL